MAEVFLRRLTRWQAEQQREGMADLYVACHEPGGGDRRAFLERFERHVQEVDFDMVTANSAGVLAGCLYGFRPERGGALADGFRDLLPADLVVPAGSGRLFVLTELMVLPEYRYQGVATRLRDLLLSRHATDVVTAAVPPGTESAHEVLRAWSYSKLGEFAAPPREAWLRPRSG
ncbi:MULTISPECIES: hypothetical protein [Streptomyces]|uniref:N-acetyltransferase domain-containing protein n=2 Tax=Streptomyces TaxID=1883 RepID=A0A0W7WS10_9ACTN|nr:MULTISPECIES: hypothetical protein [Streptomyces]KUF13329.1 hypothetical protein AT728_33280 [Streptomyces silvensis]MVO86575.1 hypothetical protein [Streptomyces typhae]